MFKYNVIHKPTVMKHIATLPEDQAIAIGMVVCKFGEVWLCARAVILQTDRQTDMLITVLHSRAGRIGVKRCSVSSIRTTEAIGCFLFTRQTANKRYYS